MTHPQQEASEFWDGEEDEICPECHDVDCDGDCYDPYEESAEDDSYDPELESVFDEACLAVQRIREYLEARLPPDDVQPAMELVYRVGTTAVNHHKVLATRSIV